MYHEMVNELSQLLRGNPLEWQKIDERKTLEDLLSKFLLPSAISFQALLEYLKKLGPRQVCQYQVTSKFVL
jgi:hypothetical protein